MAPVDDAPAALASGLLAAAVVSDVRALRIPNWSVLAAAVAGLPAAVILQGPAGALRWAAGLAAGAAWWGAVAWLGLGAGDAKLAMALGALLGPGVALGGPALGYVLCALCLAPWVCWRALRRLPWRGVALPMAPWIAMGTAVWWSLGIR